MGYKVNPSGQIIRRFIVEVLPSDTAEAHFELRHGHRDRIFHIAFRRSNGKLALNAMLDGKWATETSLPLPEGAVDDEPVLVDAYPDVALVRVGPLCLAVDLAEPSPEAQALTLSAAGKLVNWTTTHLKSAVSILRAGDGEISGISIAGRQLTVPADNRGELARLLLGAADCHDRLIGFHGSRQFPATFEVMDLHEDSAYGALLVAVLNPGATVFRPGSRETEAAFLEALARENGLSNLRVIGDQEISALLSDGTAELLLQGNAVLERFGAELDTLPGERRDRIHLVTTEIEVLPAHRVHGTGERQRTNLHIGVNNRWAYNQHVLGHDSASICGLDVVVAAYNVKEYLVSCVESLLCEDRDDVRVIVVDDGSTDGGGEIAAAHFAGDPRVRVERKPNGGCASARNYGRLVSNRTHIAFVDADDFVTPNFFADLLDLALYTGYEIVRGGFDFHDATRAESFYPSYEEALFKERPRHQFGSQEVMRLWSQEVIKGQPTIWRKVYRRDFLDSKRIYFPENVRAYDDYIFQLLALTAAREIYFMPDHHYHYRQHPAQDIKQGDDRHFYMLHMFGILLRRSVDEGWEDFLPYSQSIIDSIRWSASLLRPDLLDAFLQSAARFCVAVEKVYGAGVMTDSMIESVKQAEFTYHVKRERSRVGSLAGGVHWSYFSGPRVHPDTIRMLKSLQRSI